MGAAHTDIWPSGLDYCKWGPPRLCACGCLKPVKRKRERYASQECYYRHQRKGRYKDIDAELRGGPCTPNP